jgi:hypothetical protein
LAVYGFVALVSLLFGSTALRLLRPQLPRSLRFCLAPVATTTVWAWLLALGMRLGHSIRVTSLLAWVIVLLVVAAGVLWRVHSKWPARWLFVLCLLMPVVALAPAFWYGLDGYNHYQFNDPWQYCGAARHAWQYHFRQVYTNLNPLYMKFGSMRKVRATGPALIGYFSWLYIPGETQMACNVFLVHALLTLAGATAGLLRSLRLPAWAVVTGVLLLGSSRWLGNVIFMGSWDQLLALAYLPACLVLASSRHAFSGRSALLLGSFLGAVTLAYPEGSLFVLVPTGASLGWRLWTSVRPYRQHLRFAALTLVSCLLFLHVELRMVVHTLHASFTLAMTDDANRPGGTLQSGGECLPGMLGESPVAAFFGMGPEWGQRWGTFQPPAWAVPLQQFSALALAGTVLAGLLLLVRRGRADLPFAVGILLAGAVYFLLHHRYPYAAYKLVTFAWPLMVAVVVLVAGAALRSLLRPLGASLAAGVVLAFSWCISPFWIPRAFPPSTLPSATLREYHQLQQAIGHLTNGAPLLLAVQNPVTYHWLEFFLRDQPIANAMPISWSPALAPGQAQFLLTDGSHVPITTSEECWQLIYSSESFYLWKLCTKQEVAGLYKHCFLRPKVEWGAGFFPEEVSGDHCLRWCGSHGKIVITNPTGTPQLVALEFRAQTYAAETATLTLKSPFLTMDLPINSQGTPFGTIAELPPGRQVIHLDCTATPSIQPARTIVFAVEHFTVKEAETSALLVWGPGFYREEEQGTHRWRWCGRQGDLEIRNPTSRHLSLALQFVVGTYAPGPAMLTLTSSDFSDRLEVTAAGTTVAKTLDVPPGGRVIHFECPAEPFLEPTRTLVFAVHNYTLKEIDSQAGKERLVQQAMPGP